MELWTAIFLGGFILHARATTVTRLTDPHGSFESPQFPQPYHENLDLTWEISAPEGYQIVVYFTVFDLEDSYDEDLGGVCAYDYVQLESMGESKRYCGNYTTFPADAPAPLQRFRSKNNSMTIRFVTDYSNEDPNKGFKAHYVVEDRDECAEMWQEVQTAFEDWDQLVYCSHFCINVPGSYYCTCRPGYELHENNHTCKASCENQIITEEEGFIISPDYPQPYSKLTNCSWTIQVRQGLSLDLTFNRRFEIEDHDNYTECVYDYLKLEYGNVSEQYCHSVPNNGSLIKTNAREVKLQFFTDLSIELAGFNMSFATTKTRCFDARNAPENGVKSNNSKGYYEFEDIVEFSCDPGYNLIGSNSTTCQHDGTWTNPVPICEIKSCGRPSNLSAIPYSHLPGINLLNFTYRDVVQVECIKWYEISSGVAEWRCSENGLWIPTGSGNHTNDIPVCTPRCGIKNGVNRTIFHRFIAGGRVTTPNEWPWVVFIHHSRDPDLAINREVCGGALISADFVLTAAHCVMGSLFAFLDSRMAEPQHIHVWVGAHNRSSTNTSARNVRVEQIIPHPNYDDPNWDFDFALLRLGQTILMNDVVRPICLPRKTENYDLMVPGNTSGIVAGWGIHSTQPIASQILRFAEMPTVTTNVCRRRFQIVRRIYNLPMVLPLTNNKFCAGSSYGGTGSPCRGDSGGPFMVEDNSDPNQSKYFAFGLVSYGVRCSARQNNLTSFAYTVFASLHSEIIDWINQEIY